MQVSEPSTALQDFHSLNCQSAKTHPRLQISLDGGIVDSLQTTLSPALPFASTQVTDRVRFPVEVSPFAQLFEQS